MNFFTWFKKLFKTPDPIISNTANPDATKKSLHVGINDYPGTNNDLHGCIGDAFNWRDKVQNTYGYMTTFLFDNQATISNVKTELKKLITNSKAGDKLVWTYSGHGSNLPSPADNGEEEDGKDETLYLYDGHLRDDDIRDILNLLPKGVSLTCIFDSCNSGSCSRAFLKAMNDPSYYSTPKYMPPKDDEMAVRLGHLPTKRGIAYPEEGMNHILISGCKNTEFSYDAFIKGSFTGAFTYYALRILDENPKITYKDFYDKLRKELPSSDYPQEPQLEGSEENKNKIMFE